MQLDYMQTYPHAYSTYPDLFSDNHQETMHVDHQL